MVQATFLVAEPKPQEGISARKLVLETALFNVVTAYDGHSALEMLDKFPTVDAVVVHSGLGEEGYRSLIAAASTPNNGVKRLIILISPNATVRDDRADFHLSSHDPKELLDLLLGKYGTRQKS